MMAALDEPIAVDTGAAHDGIALYDDEALAVKAWNMAAGEWAGLPYAVEALGIVDIESLIWRWSAIRQHQAKAIENG